MLRTYRKVDHQPMVLVPQKEYAKFLIWQKSIKEYTPTVAEKRALAKARRNFAKGNYLTLEQYKRELGFNSR